MKTKISRILGVGVTLSLLASLLVGALPVSAVSVPQLTIPTAGDNVINTVNADYNIYFTTNEELTFGDTITIDFPTGYTTAAPTAAISASPGWITNTAPPPPTIYGGPTAINTGAFAAGAGATIVYTLGAAEVIGEQAAIRIEITAGVTNPSATGDYAVAVSTTQEITPVSSNTVTLVTPTIPPLPGTVTGYNSASEILYQNVGAGTIVAALGTTGVVRVAITAGTYAESPAIAAGQTLISTGGAATAIITGAVALNGATSVLDDITVTGGVAINIGGASVRNCVLSNAAGPSLNVATAATAGVSTGNTISGGALQSGLLVAAGQIATSTGDTYNVASTGTAITNNGTLTLSGATVTGASGVGLLNNAAVTATVTGSTFSGLDTAINTAAGTVNISTSTIDACGNAGTTAPNPRGAVHINGGTVIATANTITNSPDRIGRVTAAGTGAGSSFKFNTFTGNTGSFANGGAGTLDATNNWWGSDAGPTVASTGLVLTSPWLIAQLSNPTVAVSATSALVASAATSQAISGVTVAITTVGASTGMNLIATGNYDGNPVTAAPPADTVKSFDVYIQGPAASMLTDTATITFFGITNSGAQIWAYSANQDAYVLVSNQRVDMFNGSVIVTVTGVNTAVTVPNLGNMSGLEFVLTEPAVAPLGAPAQNTLIPLQAATGVGISPTSFSWGAVAGATSYEFEMAEYLAGGENPFIPAFLILEESPDTNGVALTTELDYLTVYAWRVRAIRGTEEGAWVTSFFTTAAEPPPPDEPDTWIIEPGETQIEWPDNITIEVPPIEQPEIPEYILWVVVAVGAILIIAVVVLIVRTRRVA